MPILSAFPAFCLLLKLGVFPDIINDIGLSFLQILADIYFDYIRGKNRSLRAHCTVNQSHPAGAREPFCRIAQPAADYTTMSTALPIGILTGGFL